MADTQAGSRTPGQPHKTVPALGNSFLGLCNLTCPPEPTMTAKRLQLTPAPVPSHGQLPFKGREKSRGVEGTGSTFQMNLSVPFPLGASHRASYSPTRSLTSRTVKSGSGILERDRSTDTGEQPGTRGRLLPGPGEATLPRSPLGKPKGDNTEERREGAP